MIPSLNMNWAWKNFTENKIATNSTPIVVSFAAGCVFQFVTMSAISCYIESDKLLYAGAIGVVVPITAFCVSKVVECKKPQDEKIKDHKKEKRKSQEIKND